MEFPTACLEVSASRRETTLPERVRWLSERLPGVYGESSQRAPWSEPSLKDTIGFSARPDCIPRVHVACRVFIDNRVGILLDSQVMIWAVRGTVLRECLDRVRLP